MNSNFLHKTETYAIIGACMEVHKSLGHGFLEAVYKDALEVEFRNQNISISREKKYDVFYKNVLLSHFYVADFVVFDEIILEIKCVKKLRDEHLAQTLNYLKVSGKKVALLVNFSRESLDYKRLIY